MITYKDIRIAINQRLSRTGIEINSRDVTEGFKRPSFFWQLDNNIRSADVSQVHKSMTVRIYFFPKSRNEYAIEVLDMQEKLEELFDLKLPVRDRQLNVDEFETFINDGVLNCSFDIEFHDGRETEKEFVDEGFREEHPIEPMEEIYFEKK